MSAMDEFVNLQLPPEFSVTRKLQERLAQMREATDDNGKFLVGVVAELIRAVTTLEGRVVALENPDSPGVPVNADGTWQPSGSNEA